MTATPQVSDTKYFTRNYVGVPSKENKIKYIFLSDPPSKRRKLSSGEESSEKADESEKDSNSESTKQEVPTNSENTSSGSSSSSSCCGNEALKNKSPSYWLEQLEKTVRDIISMLEVKT